ncbi:MAG TPA: hypothetical protein VKX45_03390 [Bryobacteraceae bacterium]|jgi:hypothetical protein|nr:hypothetical protein [Bryobacteraceae bacterium]
MSKPSLAVSHTTVVITPAEATKLLEGNTRNRPIRQDHVNKLARAIQERRWRLNGSTIVISKTGKILDGQHRLWACMLADQPFETILIRDVDDDAFTTLGDQLARTGSDLFAYYGVKNARKVAAAMTLLYYHLQPGGLSSINKNASPTPSQDELYELFCNGHQRIEDITGQCIAFRDLLAPSVAAFFKYVFGGIDQEKATTFFEQLLYGTGPNVTLPVYHVRRRLEADRARKAKLPRLEKMALIVKAWNLHLAGAPCKALRWGFDEDFPEIQQEA